MPGATRETLEELLKTALAHTRDGRIALAEAAYRKMAELAPDHAVIRYNLAVTLRTLGRLDEAVEAYRHCLRLKPDNAKALNNLGAILALKGRRADAAASYERALALQPSYANAHYNFANLLREQDDFSRAVHHYRQALAAAPDDAETHNNLGMALVELDQTRAAIEHYQRALALRPDYADACSNLGAALERRGQVEAAMGFYDRALALAPDHADARYNLAGALSRSGRMVDAERQYELALALDPTHARAHNNFGRLSHQLGRFDEALARYGRAQSLKPGYADAHWNEAVTRLLLGDFEIGWRKYEWRWRRRETPPRRLAPPLWDGGDLNGRMILLYAEQGAGDAIQFVRYAAQVKARGGVVVLESPAALRRLFLGVAGVDRQVTAGDALPAFHHHAPLLSLPGLMQTRAETIPADIPYLKAEPDLVAEWRRRFGDLRRTRIGLAWRGNPAHDNDHNRSMPAPVLATLIEGLDADWVSLQVDATAAELSVLAANLRYDAGPQLRDWADTAAAIEALDLVITVDTAIAHLAGALGKPAWVMLPSAPDWRWRLDRADTPWYPSLRLFRQPASGDWPSVLAQVRTAVRALAGGVDARDAPVDRGEGAGPRRPPRRLPPVMVVSHERSGTHFLMNALSYAYGYTAQPWVDLDAHEIAIDYTDPNAIAQALEARADDALLRLVKSHHAAEMFAPALERIAETYRIVYIHREPSAVMISLWRHLRGLDWDEGPKAVDPLALAQAIPSGRLLRYQAVAAPTMLTRWAAHVQGWLSAASTNPRIVLIRYEDLDGAYEQTIAALAPTLGRTPQSPLLRPSRDLNVIVTQPAGAELAVSASQADALQRYCRSTCADLMQRLGYGSAC